MKKQRKWTKEQEQTKRRRKEREKRKKCIKHSILIEGEGWPVD
jgi:hypothetical protein